MKVNYTDWMHVHGRETYCLQITIIDPVVTQRLCWWFCTCVYMYIWLPQETTIVKMTYFSSLQKFVVCLYLFSTWSHYGEFVSWSFQVFFSIFSVRGQIGFQALKNHTHLPPKYTSTLHVLKYMYVH